MFRKQQRQFLLSHLVNHLTVKFPPVAKEMAEVRLVRPGGINGGIFGHGAVVFHSLELFLFSFVLRPTCMSSLHPALPAF